MGRPARRAGRRRVMWGSRGSLSFFFYHIHGRRLKCSPPSEGSSLGFGDTFFSFCRFFFLTFLVRFSPLFCSASARARCAGAFPAQARHKALPASFVDCLCGVGEERKKATWTYQHLLALAALRVLVLLLSVVCWRHAAQSTCAAVPAVAQLQSFLSAAQKSPPLQSHCSTTRCSGRLRGSSACS